MSLSAFEVVWSVGDAPFRFVAPELRLELPNRRTVELDLAAWLALREVLRLLPDEGPPALPRVSGPANKGKPWSADEEERLRAAWKAGDEPPEIATALGRTRHAVLARAVRLGLAEAGDVGLRFTE